MTETYEYPVLLRVVVGSRAHGLSTADSDYDYREVFYIPTRELVGLDGHRIKRAWQESGRHIEDEGGWEVGEILKMGLHGHPNSLEVFAAPLDEDNPGTDEGRAIQALLPKLLSRGEVRRAYKGWAHNCLKKVFEQKTEGRATKWTAAYLRALYVGMNLLKTGELVVNMMTPEHRLVGDAIMAARTGKLDTADVIRLGGKLEVQLEDAALDSALPEKPDEEYINEWLVQFRKDHWE